MQSPDEDDTYVLDISKCEAYESDAHIEAHKRTQIPAGFWWGCPRCGHRNDEDFSSDYLSYPVWNKPYHITLSCRECANNDWYDSYDIQIIPRATIEIVIPACVTTE